jgi:hypothetical protein
MKLEFSRQVFRKKTHIKFHQNSSGGSQVVPCGQTEKRTDGRTEGHDEANSRFPQFANASNKE